MQKFKTLNKYLITAKKFNFGYVYLKPFIWMGEYISSVAVGIYALLGFETENDDDDSDSGSGGLMNPIWKIFSYFFLIF